MRKSLATLGVVTAIAAGGCGGANKPSAERATTPAHPASASTAGQHPVIDVYHGKTTPSANVLAQMKLDPLLNSMDHYRQRVYERRRATVLLGACATWPNLSGGFTATVNPGVGEYETKRGAQVSYFIFSYYNVKDPSAIEQMNGPESVLRPDGSITGDDSQLGLELFAKNHIVELADVPLSGQPVIDQAGREYFKDAKTDQPVMLTGLAPTAQYNEANINAACQALLHHTSLPGVLVA